MTPQRQVFTLPSYTMTSGRTIRNVQVGYETYGTLNAARDNAILVCHYFSGTAHAAGKYQESDPLPGWWDAAIGPGKAIDTDKYFVICSDSLCCVKVFDGQVVTTGPASIDPDTGKPYGLDFPITSVADMVRVQKALVDHLGIAKLAAVAGPSAGSVKSVQWAVEFPDMVERVVAVICPGLILTPYGRSTIELWASPIRRDPAWKNGAYDPKEQPLTGIAEAFRLTFMFAISPAWMEKMFGNDGWANPAKDPAVSIHHQFKSYSGVGALAAMGAPQCDANHLLYMARAAGIYDAKSQIAKAKAKFLFIPVSSDLCAPVACSEAAVRDIRAAGGRAEMWVLDTDGGHFDGLSQISLATPVIREFLASD